jgi:ligand-binding sensor domain-containing protein
MRRSYFLCLLLFIPLISDAQSVFKHIDNKNGLSNNTVLTIIQDKKGFMWFGTDDGLNRYDGHTFKVFKPDFKNKKGISHNIAKILFEDHAGNIWIGTDGGGLNKFDPVTEEFTNFYSEEGNAKGLSHSNITSIAETKDNYLWIGTYGGGLNRLNLTSYTFDHFVTENNNANSVGSVFINCLTTDDNGNLWIGTWGKGFDKLNINTMTFTHYQHDPDAENSLSDNTVNSIFIDSEKRIWAGTWEGGLNLLDQKTQTFSSFSLKRKNLSTNNVRAICQDKHGDLWLASFGDGLIRFQTKTNTAVNFRHSPEDENGICSNNLWTCYYSPDNILWVGSIEGGMSRLDFNRKKFVNIKNVIADNSEPDVVDYLYETKNKQVFIGTFGKGLIVLDSGLHISKDSRFNVPLLSNKITSVLEDSHGIFWIGTDAGVTTINSKNKVVKNYVIAGTKPGLSFSNIKVIYEDHAGTIWIGTWGGGINRYNRNNDSFDYYFTSNGLTDAHVWSICEDHEGILWIGTNDGLNRFDKINNAFSSYKRENTDSTSLSDNHVSCIFEDKNLNLWIGTLGGGINLFDRSSNAFVNFSEKDGLANNIIKSILEDEHHNLWISTNNGLSRFNYITHKFKNYNLANGLENNIYRIDAAVKRTNGEMLFGGTHGISRFTPDSISTNLVWPKVYISDLFLSGELLTPKKKINGEVILDSAITYTSTVHLSYDQNALSFKFASPEFGDSGEPVFSYTLEGFDKQWYQSHSSDNLASYTNLPPGEYKFMVKVSNDEGTFGKGIAQLNISISPPFWGTPLFKSLVMLFFIGCLYAGYKIIERKKEEKLRQATLLADQKIKDLENEKLQNEIDFKNKELATISMNLIEKTKFLNEQIKRLETIANISEHDVKSKLNNLIENFNKEITTEKDWEYFEFHFDKVHQNFIAKLKNNFPDLTAVDIRLAALIRMDLANKEIADLMNKSVRSIESSRYRLRKSLNLKQGDNLTDFLFRL